MKNFWKNKKVLVTGAAGFVGSHAVEALVQKNAKVTAVVSPKTTSERLKEMFEGVLEDIDVKYANLLLLEDCLNVTQSQEIILNFAAMDGGAAFKQKYPAQIFKTNTEIVLHMLEAAVKNKVDRFLLMSSIEVYPKNAKNTLTENYGLEEDFQNETNGYVWSKRFNEIAAKMYYKEFNLPVTIVRAGNLYGPRDYAQKDRGRVIPAFIDGIIRGVPIQLLGGGSLKRSFLYISDFIEAALDLTEKYCICEPVNIASEHYISIKELADLIGRIIHKKIEFQSAGETAGISRFISIEKAKKLISYKEKMSLENGLKEIIKHYEKI